MLIKKLLQIKNYSIEELFKIFLSIYIVFYFIPIGIVIEGISIIIILVLVFKKLKQSNNIFQEIVFKDIMTILIILFAIFQIISSFTAYNIIDSFYQFRKDFLMPIIVGFSILVFYKEINFIYIYKTITITLFLVCIWYLYETYQIHGSLNLNDYNLYTPRDASFTIPILFPFVIFGLYAFYKEKIFTIIALISMSLAIILVVYCGSRGAIVAFTTEIIVFLLFTILSKNWKYILFPIVFTLILFFIFHNESIAKKFHDATNRGIDPNGRITTLTNFTQPALDHWLLGIGMGAKNTEIIIKEYQFKAHFGKDGNGTLIAGPHNTFLKILYQNGILALICYVLIILIVVARTIKYKKHINDIQGKLAFAIVTVFLDHFVLRGSVEDLKIGKFYLIVFISIALYNTTLKKDKKSDSSIRLS